VLEIVETYLYRPALGSFMAIVAAAKRLQSGRLDAYLLYMLIALVAIIAVATHWPDTLTRVMIIR